VLPSASNSLLLPTDQEAIDFPTKTLISVSTTGAIGGLSTEKRKELRFWDVQYCATYFPGHAVLSPLDAVGKIEHTGAGRQARAAQGIAAQSLSPTLKKAQHRV
jgi:hypothetical protein